MSIQGSVTVATVNTYFGQALRAEHGLKGVLVSADIIGFQELYDPTTEDEVRLKEHGFEFVAQEPRSGLGIAVRTESELVWQAGLLRNVVLQRAGKFGIAGAERIAGRPLGYENHGICAAKFRAGKFAFTFAVAHAPIVMAPWKRVPFINNLTSELGDSYYEGPLIIVGDMNHYPGPHESDKKMREVHRLIDAETESSTWPSSHAKSHERLIGHIKTGRLDVILYRDLAAPTKSRTVTIMSDHRALVATFPVD